MEGYKCSKCGVSGVKLWRESFSFHVELVCFKCSGDKRELSADGFVESAYVGVLTDQIAGSLVPAVMVDGQSNVFWGYTSVPDADVLAWRALPNEK